MQKLEMPEMGDMEAHVVDLSDWTPDMTYEEGVRLCRKLKLIETVDHGEHEYARLTANGRGVLFTLMTLAAYATDPKNYLKKT